MNELQPDKKTLSMVRIAARMVLGDYPLDIKFSKIDGHYDLYIIIISNKYAGLDMEQIARDIKSYVKRYIRIRIEVRK